MTKLLYYIFCSPPLMIGYWYLQKHYFGYCTANLLQSCIVHWFQTVVMFGAFVPIILPLTAFAIILQGLLLTYGMTKFSVICTYDYCWPLETVYICMGFQFIGLILFASLEIGMKLIGLLIVLILSILF
eukprot:UN27446